VCATEEKCVASKCSFHFTGATGTSWTSLGATPSAFDGPGFSDYSPAGSPSFYWLEQNTFQRHDNPDTWVPLAAPPTNMNFWPGTAWVGSSLYSIKATAVQVFDITAGTWSTKGSGLPSTAYSQTTHDDSGNLYAVGDTSPYPIIQYNIAAGTWKTFTSGFTISNEPHLTWDPVTKKIYVYTSYSNLYFYSFDPATGTVTSLTSISDPGTTGMNDVYCGDRSGHVYTAGGTNGCSGGTTPNSMWQYDTVAGTWKRLPDLPFDHGCNGACTVTDDGFLYVSNGYTKNLAKIPLY
jgi:hypothetical protein